MKTEKNRKLHGSVLLTVVFVMSILIVFLFGTMTLALATNNRAHANYSSAQTGITARNVAESTIRAIGSSTPSGLAFAQVVGDIDSPGESMSVPVSITGGAGMGHVDDVEIAYAGSRMYQDPATMLWDSRDVLRFTARVTLGGVTSTSSIYVMKNFVNTPPPPPSRGMGFSTTAQATLSSQPSIWGGGYIGIPTLDVAQSILYNDNHDFLKTYFENEGIPETRLQNSASGYAADLYVFSDLHIENCNTIYFPEKGTGITVWGDMTVNTANNRSHLKYLYNGPTDEFDFTEIPYVYVDGKFTGALIGPQDASFPVNLFCGSINAETVNEDWMSANIYCMDSDKDNYIGANNPSAALKAWTGSVIHQTVSTSPVNTVCGDVCVKGNLEIKNVTVKGDLRVAGDCKFGDHVSVEGNVVVGGTMTGSPSAVGGTIYSSAGGGDTVEADNKVYYYYRYTPTFDGDKYYGINGNVLNIPGYIVNGELVDGVDPSAVSYVYYFIGEWQTINDEIIDSEDRKNKVADWIDPIPDAEVKFAGSQTDRYYAETTVEVKDGAYEYKGEVGKPVADATFEHENLLGVAGLADAMSIYSSIYPDYAERENIVGSDQKYKIVNKVEEVFSAVSDPYEYDMDLDDLESFKSGGAVKSKIAEVYDLITETQGDGSVKNLVPDFPVFTNEASVEAGVGKFVSNLYGDTVNGMQKYNINVSASIADKVPGTVYIDRNCTLDMSLEGGKTIVLDPGASGIVIVVDNLTLAKDATIVVRDNVQGRVHMIVRSGCKFDHKGSSGDGCVITTTSYWNTFADHYGEIYKVVSRAGAPYVDADVDMTNMKPNLYIYGETTKGGDSNPILNFSDFTGYATANIVSPNLDLNIASTNGNAIVKKAIDSLYYDGLNISNYSENPNLDCQYAIFGAVNSEQTNIPNVLSVVYIPEGNNGGGAIASDPVYSYFGLYYDEY